jgi:hypothetical protein
MRLGVVLSPIITTVVATSGSAVASEPACGRLTVAAGQTAVVERTTCLRSLTVGTGAALAAPDGYSLSLTVDGVETGSALIATGATTTAIQPGQYRGNVVLTVAKANPVAWQAFTFPFRQALYVDGSGVVADESVLSAVRGGRLSGRTASDVAIASTGEAFNGVYVGGGDYNLVGPRISLTGNGRSDFVGYGAAVTATGTGTRLVVDGARITNRGAVRTGVVAAGGSNVIVKNSAIHTGDGTLPPDYQSTVDLSYMEQAPWMLGIVGDVRATNLVGDDTRAAYVNSDVSSQGWGVLSTDSGSDMQLTSIDSRLRTTGDEGYGSYAIGNATERFLGTTMNVGTYGAINRGGAVYYGDSTPAAVSSLNSSLDLGLSARELAALPTRPTVINSAGWGVMWHGEGSVDVSGGTRINTRRSTFLDKGQAVGITVDGSRGAQLNPRDGVILQVMENDDPGPQMVDGKLLNTGVYTEPTGDPAKASDFDVTTATSDDATATFENIKLAGDFYNGIRGGATGGGPFGGPSGKNMVLTFDNSKITGVISATRTAHAQSTITSADYKQLGVVSNTVTPVVNNGVIVTLGDRSAWTVTGTSYLSRLTVAAGAELTAPAGKSVAMTVDGVPTPIVPGTTYTGAVVLTVG